VVESTLLAQASDRNPNPGRRESYYGRSALGNQLLLAGESLSEVDGFGSDARN
jgi:hypothetical protein